MKAGWKLSSLIYILIMIAAIAFFSNFLLASQKPNEIDLSQAITLSQEGKIQKVIIDGDAMLLTTTDGKEFKTFKEPNTSIYDIKGLNLTGVDIAVKGSSGFNWSGLLVNLLPLV